MNRNRYVAYPSKHPAYYPSKHPIRDILFLPYYLVKYFPGALWSFIKENPNPGGIMMNNDPLWDRSKPGYMIPRESDGSGMGND